MSLKWLDSMLKLGDETTEQMEKDFFNPQETKDGERVLCTIDGDLLRLFKATVVLAHRTLTLAKKHDAEHEAKTATRETCQKTHAEIDACKDEAHAVRAIFWKEVRHQFDPNNECEDLEIKAGYQIIVVPPKSQRDRTSSLIITDLSDLLRFLD